MTAPSTLGRATPALGIALACLALACNRPEAPGNTGEAKPPVQAAEAHPEPATTASSGLSHAARTVGGKKDDSLPWIVAIHGLGDAPQAFIGLVSEAPVRAHVYAPRAIYPYGDGFDWYGVRLDAPPEELAGAMQTAVDAVMLWLDELDRDPKNLGKPVVIGFSQGGMLSFALATQHPERFRAAIPIAGMLPRPLWPARSPKGRLPIHALHGSEDRVIEVGPTEALIEQLQKTEHDVTLEVFPGVAHRIPMPVRERLYAHLAHALGQ